MTMPADFRALCLSFIGDTVGPRFYPARIPDEVQTGPSMKPCAVYAADNGQRGRTFCGSDGTQRETLRVDVYTHSFDTSRALGGELTAGLDNFRGIVGATQFLGVFFENGVDLYDMDPGLYRRSLTFTVWYRT